MPAAPLAKSAGPRLRRTIGKPCNKPTGALQINLQALQAATESPAAAPPAHLLSLQRTYGNRAVGEAIRRASQIGAEGGLVDAHTQSAIQSARGGGAPLDAKVSSQLGSALGTDFGGVKVHTGPQADALNSSLSARAFTAGRDIFFSQGAYQPGSSSGKALLAHELTHVVQQGSAKPSKSQRVQTKLAVGAANDQYEQAADGVAEQVVSGRGTVQMPSLAGGGPLIRRKLAFTKDQMQVEVSKSAKKSGKFGKTSTYTLIQHALSDYWDDAKTTTEAERWRLVQLLVNLCAVWLKKNDDSGEDTYLKRKDIRALKAAAETELPKVLKRKQFEEYKNKFGSADEFPSRVENVTSDPAADEWKAKLANEDEKAPDRTIKDVKGALKHNREPREKFHAETLEKVEIYKTLSATERAAIKAYTGEQYRLMNPAMAGDKGWFGGSVNTLKGFGLLKTLDPTSKSIEQAMAHNKELGAMADSGLKKLPEWKQTKTIYRGETVPEDVGSRMERPLAKVYPHFVSTSQDVRTPRVQTEEHASPARPFKVIYHITKSSNGRNIAMFSNKEGEEEILFPKGSRLTTGAVVKRIDSGIEIEAEIH